MKSWLPRTFALGVLLLLALGGCSGGGEGEGCEEGVARCSGNQIEVCSFGVAPGGSIAELRWIEATDCEATAQECTTNVARCGGIGPCCAD